MIHGPSDTFFGLCISVQYLDFFVFLFPLSHDTGSGRVTNNVHHGIGAVYSIRLYHPSPLRPSFCFCQLLGFAASTRGSGFIVATPHAHTPLLEENPPSMIDNNNHDKMQKGVEQNKKSPMSDADIQPQSIPTDRRRGCMTDVVIYQMRCAGGARVLKVSWSLPLFLLLFRILQVLFTLLHLPKPRLLSCHCISRFREPSFSPHDSQGLVSASTRL